MKKNIIAVLTIVAMVAALSLTGCTSAVYDQSIKTNEQLKVLQANQPQPVFSWSQFRQTVIDKTVAQAQGVTTMTFFMLAGVPDPVDSCASIGYPVPATTQLTDPALAEMNGVYPGSTDGTYIVCVTPEGNARLDLWEGSTLTKGGPAHWDYTLHRAVLDGAATVIAGTKK